MNQHLALPVLATLLLSACATTPTTDQTLVTIQRAQPMMGTTVEITLSGKDYDELQAVASRAFAVGRDFANQITLHGGENELQRLNRAAGNDEFHELSASTYELLALSKEISSQTKGAFDVTIAPLVQLWGFLWKTEYRHPKASEIAATLPKVDFQNIELRTPNRARLRKPGMQVDLGGIGKGAVLDQMVSFLRAQSNIAGGRVQASSDVFCFGPDACSVGIRHPRQAQAIVAVVKLRNQAISTSGDYENFFIKDGVRYSHLLDPKTGTPVKANIASLSVVADKAVLADAYSTALFVLSGRRNIEPILQELQNLAVMRIMVPVEQQPLQIWRNPNWQRIEAPE